MLHIAVCDDDKEAVLTHKYITEICLKQLGTIGEITLYNTSDNLLYDITEDSFLYDLILLDIEKPGCSGMEIAETIKPFLPILKYTLLKNGQWRIMIINRSG